MDYQPTLEDDLIFLRPMREDDFDMLYNVAKDPLIWQQHQCKDRYKKENFREFFTDSMGSNGALIAIDKSTNEIIGSSRFKPVNDTANAVEIGWSFLSRKYWGGQYNKSMKKLMLDYAFGFVEGVVFYIDMNNIRSQKAVEKIGGRRVIENNLRHLASNRETDWTYRINKEDWNDLAGS